MDFPVFDSRDSRCKLPFGAVPCGTTITLSLRPLAAEGFRGCHLIVTGEFSGTREEIALSPAGAWFAHVPPRAYPAATDLLYTIVTNLVPSLAGRVTLGRCPLGARHVAKSFTCLSSLCPPNNLMSQAALYR